MRLTVIHDRSGTIAGIVAYPKDAPPAFPETSPGQYMVEMDAPSDLLLSLDGRVMNQRLAELVRTFKVDVTATRPGLARKA
jgi:hypothetical protein